MKWVDSSIWKASLYTLYSWNIYYILWDSLQLHLLGQMHEYYSSTHLIPSRFQITHPMEENQDEQTIDKTHTQCLVFHKISLCFLCKYIRSILTDEGSRVPTRIHLIMQEENIFPIFLPGVTLLSLCFQFLSSISHWRTKVRRFRGAP